MQIKTLVTGTI